MEIGFNRKSYGMLLSVKADNVNIEEDVEERTYFKDENGKNDYMKVISREPSTDSIDMIVTVLEDMLYYRETAYDSSSLIEILLEKMSEKDRASLLESACEEYETENAKRLVKEIETLEETIDDLEQTIDDLNSEFDIIEKEYSI